MMRHCSRGALLLLLWASRCMSEDLPQLPDQAEGHQDQLVDLYAPYWNANYTSGEKYTLIFTLNGPSGDGLLKTSVQIQQFIRYMQDLTPQFAPEFATGKEVKNVSTLCTYTSQRSYDGDLLVQGRVADRVSRISKTTRSIYGRADSFWDSFLNANTTYVYQYLMNYTSNMIRTEDYPNFYEATMRNSIPEFTAALRDILNVQEERILTVKALLADANESTPVESLPVENVVFPLLNDTATVGVMVGNEPKLVNITQTPTVSPSPSLSPTITPGPTTTSAPTYEPTISPSRSPTVLPSQSPTMFPTFFTNSSSRGRYELTFIVTGPRDPKTMFVNNTKFCELMSSYTYDIAPEGQNPEQVYTTCPTIDGAYAPAPTLAPDRPVITDEDNDGNLEINDEDGDGDLDVPIPPAASPHAHTLAPTNRPLITDEDNDGNLDFDARDEDGDGDFDIPIPPAVSPHAHTLAPAHTLETPSVAPAADDDAVANETSGRALFLRGSSSDTYDDMDRWLQLNGTIGLPTMGPDDQRILWRYTIVMRWTSAYWDVSDYPDLLHVYINENQDELEAELIEKFNLTNSTLEVVTFLNFTDITQAPSASPSSMPSDFPTQVLTLTPTKAQSEAPSGNYSGILPPEPGRPSSGGNPMMPSTPESNLTTPSPAPSMPLTPAPTDDPEDDNSHAVVIAVVVLVVFFCIAVMACLFYVYRERIAKLHAYKRNLRPNPEASAAMPSSLADGGEDMHARVSTAATISPSTRSDLSPLSQEGNHPSTSVSTASRPHHSKESSNGSASLASTVSDAVSSQDSQQSASQTEQQKKNAVYPTHSILSDIEEDPYSTDDLGEDNDGEDDDDGFEEKKLSKMPPLDPFAQYNDQNLERMRSNVEESVAGLDGMMSQAMTMALMNEPSTSETSPWFGAKTGVEIEANALWEVTDWLRLHLNVREDQKQEYMQELLNKMVTSVREGLMDPEDASRTIHECAHLLGLQLANQLPVETIILTGMQKTTTAQDILSTFRAFGPVEDAAVAANRGFGLVRFRNQNAMAAAMEQCRTREVVVKDVAITLRKLSAHGN